MACTGGVHINHCQVLDWVAVHRSESAVLRFHAGWAERSVCRVDWLFLAFVLGLACQASCCDERAWWLGWWMQNADMQLGKSTFVSELHCGLGAEVQSTVECWVPKVSHFWRHQGALGAQYLRTELSEPYKQHINLHLRKICEGMNILRFPELTADTEL